MISSRTFYTWLSSTSVNLSSRSPIVEFSESILDDISSKDSDEELNEESSRSATLESSSSSLSVKFANWSLNAFQASEASAIITTV